MSGGLCGTAPHLEPGSDNPTPADQWVASDAVPFLGGSYRDNRVAFLARYGARTPTSFMSFVRSLRTPFT